MKVTVKRIEGLAMAARAESRHWVAMDGPAEVGGVDAGSRPLELLLMALGGCTAMDVVSILTKKRASVEDFEIEVEAERADAHPRVFTKIHVTYRIVGSDIDPKDVARAIALSEEKYCSVGAMLRASAVVTSRFEILEPPSRRA